MQTDLTSQLPRLAEPVTPDNPCGTSLDDTPELATFDACRVFGLLTPPTSEPDWRDLATRSLATLQTHRDLRILAHLVAATLRTRSLTDALPLFVLIHTWLERYWDAVHPQLDDDAVSRRNALNCFSDRVAIIDPLRRLPILVHPQLGAFSLRDIDIATGVQPNPDPEREPRSETEVAAALAAANADELVHLMGQVKTADQALRLSQEIMRARAGETYVPQFDPLVAQLTRIQQLLIPRIELESGRDTQAASQVGDSAARPAGTTIVRSRQDAVRALEAVADYFRRNEPASPVPLIVERARRLVSMDFLEVLADLAPDALEQARRATGVRGSD